MSIVDCFLTFFKEILIFWEHYFYDIAIFSYLLHFIKSKQRL